MASVCQRLGLESNLAEMKTLCGYKDSSGVTLLGLMNAAKAKNLQAVAMKIGLDELASFKGPAIAHLWDNHFVVIDPGDAGTVMVTEPPDGPRAVKVDALKKAYSGFALLVSSGVSSFPKSDSQGPDLRLDAYTCDFESVYQGDIASYALKCRNAGTTDIAISKVEVSCSCLVVQDYPRTLPPGGEGVIRLLLDSSDERRAVDKHLVISSNDPISPDVRVNVVGYVRPKTLLMSPRAVDFSNPRRSESPVRQVYIPSTQDDHIEVLSVSSDSPYVDAAFSKSTDSARPGYIVTVTLRPGMPIGVLNGKLTIASSHPKQPKAELSVAATIRGDIDLNRRSFFFGIVKKGAESKTTLTISTVGKDPLKIGKIHSSIGCVSVHVAPTVEGKEYALMATLSGEAPVGNVKGDVVIHTNDPDQPDVTIPVYAYVE